MQFTFRLAYVTHSLAILVPHIIRESAQAWKEREQ